MKIVNYFFSNKTRLKEDMFVVNSRFQNIGAKKKLKSSQKCLIVSTQLLYHHIKNLLKHRFSPNSITTMIFYKCHDNFNVKISHDTSQM